MDQNRIGRRHSLKLLCFLLTIIILPTDLTTEICSNCLDSDCHGSGACTKGCIDGFADKYCQHKCQPTCKDAKCQLDKLTGKMICLSGCEDGYCGQQCKAPCVDGCSKCDSHTCTCPRCNGSFYGNKCQESCLDRCLVCDNKGQCMSCRDGWYGINCEQLCGSKCIQCKQETGKCIKYQQGFNGDLCDQVSTEKTIYASDWNPPIILIVVLNIMIFGCLFPKFVSGFIAYVKRQKDTSKSKQEAEMNSSRLLGQHQQNDAADEHPTVNNNA